MSLIVSSIGPAQIWQALPAGGAGAEPPQSPSATEEQSGKGSSLNPQATLSAGVLILQNTDGALERETQTTIVDRRGNFGLLLSINPHLEYSRTEINVNIYTGGRFKSFGLGQDTGADSGAWQVGARFQNRLLQASYAQPGYYLQVDTDNNWLPYPTYQFPEGSTTQYRLGVDWKCEATNDLTLRPFFDGTYRQYHYDGNIRHPDLDLTGHQNYVRLGLDLNALNNDDLWPAANLPDLALQTAVILVGSQNTPLITGDERGSSSHELGGYEIRGTASWDWLKGSGRWTPAAPHVYGGYQQQTMESLLPQERFFAGLGFGLGPNNRYGRVNFHLDIGHQENPFYPISTNAAFTPSWEDQRGIVKVGVRMETFTDRSTEQTYEALFPGIEVRFHNLFRPAPQPAPAPTPTTEAAADKPGPGIMNPFDGPATAPPVIPVEELGLKDPFAEPAAAPQSAQKIAQAFGLGIFKLQGSLDDQLKAVEELKKLGTPEAKTILMQAADEHGFWVEDLSEQVRQAATDALIEMEADRLFGKD